jgi:hypothetical protein
MKNRALQYMLSKNTKDLYKPISSYITYDFETMNNTHVNNKDAKATKKENTLHLLSLAFTVVINFEIVTSSSYYLCNFADEVSMVMQFLDDMKKYAPEIIRANNRMKDLPSKYFFKEVPILGFNSAKFDMNLLVKYLCIEDYKIESTLGKNTYYKCLKVKSIVDDKEITLRFVDIMIYAPECTFDQFTQDYTEKKVV